MADTTNFALEKPAVGGYRNSWGGTLNTGLDKIDELLALALPVGTIQLWPKTTAPAATANGGTWLLCNGSELLKTAYPDLSSAIAATFGDGPSGVLYFKLPDFRARVPVGYNTDATLTGRSTRAIAANGGEETHVLTEGEMNSHNHGVTDPGHDHDFKVPSHTHDGGTTGSATLSLTDPGHTHTIKGAWETISPTALVNDMQSRASPPPNSLSSESAITNITITDPHDHSFDTEVNSDALDVISGDTDAVQTLASIGITTQVVGSDTAHNNMPTFLVVNYIILAKHPTF